MDLKTSYTQEYPTICNICGGKVILIKTDKNYDRSRFVYKCIECGASVGTHPNSTRAIGLLANKETKDKRREVHTWFDKLWRCHEQREMLYEKLAVELGIPRIECHFGIMSDEMLDKALVIIKKWWLEKFDI